MAIYRKALEKMKAWMDNPRRKPLVLEGARQVGKTWIMHEFGRLYFKDVFYINFDTQVEYKKFFEDTKQPSIIIDRLSLARSKKIEPQKTLIIFDEIQECPNALNALKYFNEEAKEYFVITAGSLLGVYLAKRHAHPVGQVNIIEVFPLDFEEFIQAIEPRLFQIYKRISNDLSIINVFHNDFVDAYKKYLLIGGMPEIVKSWIETADFTVLKSKFHELQQIYERDFSKHHGEVEPERILMVYRNIPVQLAKENNRFVYGDIGKGARARNFETAIEWLVTAGLIHRVYRTKKNEHPLKVFNDLGSFKLYFFDTGLIRHISNVANEAIMLDKDFQFKGALTENYVLQQLKSTEFNEPQYFTFAERYEIDFLVQDSHGDIIPIEVKSGESVSSASFNVYSKTYAPKKQVRFSLLPFRKDGDFVNIPLYLAGKISELI